MIKHVAEKPGRHKRLIQRPIDSNDAILFLDCAKDEILLWAMLSPATPHDFVTAEAPAKVTLVQVVKHRAQIEMCPLVKQIQLPLHRQFRMRELSFRLFLRLCVPSHLRFPPEIASLEDNLVGFKSGDK
jgi:hypothetical protein